MVKMKSTYFWVLSCTWGIVMTLIGSLVALFLIMSKHKPRKLGPCFYFTVKCDLEVLSLGPFFIVNEGCGSAVAKHGVGHCIQNAILGPLMLTVVLIPSLLRFVLRHWEFHDDRFCVLTIIFVSSCLVITLPLAFIARSTHPYFLDYLAIEWGIYSSVLYLWQLYKIRAYYYKGVDEPYNSIWFESWATKLGDIHMGEL